MEDVTLRVLSLHEAQALVWKLLDRDLNRRPTMSEVARESGHTELQLRRAVARHNRTLRAFSGASAKRQTFRDVLTYSCLT